MAQRVFNIACLVSATLLAVTVLLCLVAFFSNPNYSFNN